MYPPSDFAIGELEVENSEGMTRVELLTYKRKIEFQEKQQEEGYKCIKNKVTELRKGYKNAIDTGARSGSGRLIEDNFDRLKEIWGGSPVAFATGISLNDRGDGEPSDEENYGNEITDHKNEEGIIDDENNDGLNTRTVNRDNARPSLAICKEKKRKRQHMQKKLSSYQRDMMLEEQSKEKLKLKIKTYELNNSIQTADKAIESLASAVTHLGDSIKDGLALLAQSFAQNSSVLMRDPPTTFHPLWNIHFQQPAFIKVAIDLRNKTNF